MASLHPTCCSVVLVLVMGCGGKAVVDGTSAAGGGGNSGIYTTTTSVPTVTTSTVTTTITSTTTTWTTTSTTTDLCEQLRLVLDGWLESALACNPMLSVEQCTGALVVYDECGCALAANATTPDLAAGAGAAYQEWVLAGCGPWDCDWCPPGPPSPWFCMPDVGGQTGTCQPAWDG